MSRALLPFGRLDRYVARLFGASYLAAFFGVVGIYTVLDMAANLDDYLQPDASGESPSFVSVLHFYGLQLPFLYLSMSPFVTLMGGLFTAARMARCNEIVAVLNSGVSIRRMFAPVFLGALLLALGMFGLREWVTGEIGTRRDALLDRLTERRPLPVFENFWVTDEGGRNVRIPYYTPGDDGGRVPEIHGLATTEASTEQAVSVHVERALWSAAEGHWVLEGGSRFVRDNLRKELQPIDDLGDIRFSPADVELAWKGRSRPLELSFSECVALLERDPENSSFRTLLHYHMTFPMAGLVLLMVGMPFVTSPRRGHAAERVAMGLLLCVGYFGVDFVSRTLGLQGHLGPIHACWLPIVFFGSLGFVMLASMRS